VIKGHVAQNSKHEIHTKLQ